MKIGIGQQVYITYARGKGAPFFAYVDTVGRKWFTVKGLNTKFSTEDLSEKKREMGWGYDFNLYLSKEDRDNELKLIDNRREIMEIIKGYITLEQSIAILNILK